MCKNHQIIFIKQYRSGNIKSVESFKLYKNKSVSFEEFQQDKLDNINDNVFNDKQHRDHRRIEKTTILQFLVDPAYLINIDENLSLEKIVCEALYFNLGGKTYFKDDKPLIDSQKICQTENSLKDVTECTMEKLTKEFEKEIRRK